ncbi:PD-(D/E)XK nuclease family protein [bacterium]|nr:PD-(D/E)XK nuclease family protein [bacterium]
MKVSVSEIVSALTRKEHYSSYSVPRRGLLGLETHQSYLSQFPHEQTEQHLRGEFISSTKEILTITGRVDFLEIVGDDYVIREFKTIIAPPGSLQSLQFKPQEGFTLQTQLYAYLCYRKFLKNGIRNPSQVKCFLVLHNLTDLESLEQEVLWSVKSVEECLEEFSDKQNEKIAWRHAEDKRRKRLGSSLKWPLLKYREGQKRDLELIDDLIKKGQDIMWEAPPGYGKTLTALLPALKNSLKSGCKLFYATAKGGGRQPVKKAIQTIIKKYPDLKTMFLSARADLCIMEDSFLSGCRTCELERIDSENFRYSQLPNELIEHNLILEEDFIRLGREFQTCPADLAHVMIDLADLVVGDYNYVIDPSVRLTQFTNDKNPESILPWLLIIDEAHNLFNRGREIYSVEIKSLDVSDCHRLIEMDQWRYSHQENFHLLRDTLAAIITLIQHELDSIEAQKIVFSDPDEFAWVNLFKGFEKQMAKFILDNLNRIDPEIEVALWAVYQNVWYLIFLLEGDRISNLYFINNIDNSVGISCLDSKDYLADAFDRFRSILAFSGTMSPLEFYLTSLGFDSRSVALHQSDAVFDSSNLLVVHTNGYDTRYKKRKGKAGEIANVIERFCMVKKGLYLAVFPSFVFLEMVAEYFDEDLQIIKQTKSMNTKAREQFSRRLALSDETKLGLIVAGGQFSEAADYPGDKCAGIVIVGPCLSPPDPFREVLKNYWYWNGFNGEEVAFIIPGMHKVIKAGGRLIRNENDRGEIILLDDRFLEERFFRFLPDKWKLDLQKGEDWETAVKEFWVG